MAKGKGRNVKTNTRLNAANKGKRQTKPIDTAKFSNQLKLLGLRIVHVTGDGNCLFRSIADQLEGDEEKHMKYRQMVVDYIEKNREQFENFVEDDEPFDTYCQKMREDGTWAGHLELQAASLVTKRNICIHQQSSPRWNIFNFNDSCTQTIHLSYHDGEHYNSVRMQNDDGSGPAGPILIEDSNKPDYGISDSGSVSKSSSAKSSYETLVKTVIDGTGCTDVNKVRHVLQEVHGDTAAAVEYIIAEQNSEPFSVENAHEAIKENLPNNINEFEHQTNEEMHVEKQPSEGENIVVESETCIDARNVRQKQVSRNKMCPCGSKKKYKSCCEGVKQKLQRSGSKIVISQQHVSNRQRKQQQKNTLQQQKITSQSQSESRSTNSGSKVPPDLGALYI